MDYAKKQLLWPEEVSLKNEIVTKGYMQLPQQILKNPKAYKLVELDITIIRGNGFHHLVLYEIDKIIKDKKILEEKLEEEEIRKKLSAYLKDFVDIFSKHELDKLPPHRPYNYKIELEKPNELSYNSLYKMSRDELEAAQEYIIDNLNKGFLEPSSLLFAAPIIIALKLGEGLRFCVNYRKLNQLTKKDWYPLPLINKVFKCLS
ncbi:retrovirus polyprotein, putative [Talaromyces stipitatus ATCC 10500]|uniref:Retrovirus polyprotein, putative n=1 Tax=Talaromyces stipitatus (strain ATCC 10500 / CBS 375.48 / QM 6759 / NRRL 1006) TaxID=441959 RepID=B8MJP6_TALSN|nr:retrovirus polyprotein, putative [Talaromyces stipitatus ATCC 10500]EED15745.1 retrovirus polyprotein, putative [Talaromyces stipitatus ATCC 10500]